MKIDSKSKYSAELDRHLFEKIGYLYGTPDVNHWTRDKMWHGSDRITEVSGIRYKTNSKSISKLFLLKSF
jgi:hypothetical protein